MTTPIPTGRGVLVNDQLDVRVPGKVTESDHVGFWFCPESSGPFIMRSQRFSYGDGWTVEYPEPELPTERGSVILDVITEYGYEYSSAYQYSDSSWIGVRKDRKLWDTIPASRIAAFTPAKVVAA